MSTIRSNSIDILPTLCLGMQVTVSRTTGLGPNPLDGYVWSVTFDTPTVVGGVTSAGDQPILRANGRMLGATSTPFTIEVRISHLAGVYQVLR